MSSKPVPCIDCICLAMCKSEITKHEEFAISGIYFLSKKCSILELHVKSEDGLSLNHWRSIDIYKYLAERSSK